MEYRSAIRRCVASNGPAAHIVEGRWELGRPLPGSTTYWTIHPDTGWVGVILSNYHDTPLQEITGQQTQAITGATPGDG